MITYKTFMGRGLDYKLAVEVARLIRDSHRHANDQHRTYIEEGLEAYLSTPYELIRLHFETIFSVFAYDGVRLVGTGFLAQGKYPGFVIDGANAYLFGMGVDPKYKRQGIGTDILTTIVKHAKNSGLKTIQALSTNFPDTLEFYLKFCFRKLREVEIPIKESIKVKVHELELDLIK